MHDILVHVSDYATRTRSVSFAAQITRLLDGTLTGIYAAAPIQPLPQSGAPPMFPEFYEFAAQVMDQARAAEPEFLAWAEGIGIQRSRWQVAEGVLTDVLASAANWGDLLVLESGAKAEWSAVGELGHVLLTCGTPCLVVPETYAEPAALDTLAVAWSGTAESIRAVHAALPLLKRAKRIVLLHGTRHRPFSLIDWKPPLDIEKHLNWHGLHISHQLIEGEDKMVGAELLTAAWEMRADMLVMGAYGRSRFGEWVFGGATRHVLEHAKLPVFMRH